MLVNCQFACRVAGCVGRVGSPRPWQGRGEGEGLFRPTSSYCGRDPSPQSSPSSRGEAKGPHAITTCTAFILRPGFSSFQRRLNFPFALQTDPVYYLTRWLNILPGL
jgi:hypothetical protein